MNNTSVREINRKKVIKSALASFLKNGIEAAKISDIAADAGLTERSVFRYFETKSDLVLETLLLLWKELQNTVEENCAGVFRDRLHGISQINSVLKEYSEFFFRNREELLFVEEAEIYLFRQNKVHLIEKEQMLPYSTATGPLSRAIKNGLADGTVNTDKDIESLYYNTFDALLGTMQMLAVLSDTSESTQKKIRSRLDDFCLMLTNAYRMKG